VRIISLHRDGEPLLNKHLEAYISDLTEQGVYVAVASNCSLVTEERARRLIDAGLRMIGTDFCADAALYELASVCAAHPALQATAGHRGEAARSAPHSGPEPP
jgi:hypothetical protein